MQDIKNKKTIKEVLGQIIKLHRTDCNKSISLIADEIDMSKSMWADTERGKKDPQLTTLMRISEGLGLKTSDIIIELETLLGDEFSFIE